MARFTDVFTESSAPKESRPVVQKVKKIHYSKLKQSQFQYRNREMEVVTALADFLKVDGKILEPLIIRKSGPGSDTYEIISGHKRYLASKYLVEQENLDDFAFLPCIEEDFSDIRAEFAVYSSNIYDEKTPYEIMREIEGMQRLLKNYPDEFPEFAGKGRLVEKLAAQRKMSRSVVSDYQNISHNLGKTGMDYFKTGKIDKSAAVTLASLPEEKQEAVLSQGLTSRGEIKTYTESTVREPSKDEILTFWEKGCKKHLQNQNPSKWAEILKTTYGKTHMYSSNNYYRLNTSPRGIRLNSCDEITWKRYTALLTQYLEESSPQSLLNAIKADKNTEEQIPEEQIPGQDNVLEHPEWLPEQNVPTVGTKPSGQDVDALDEPMEWYQIALPYSIADKIVDKAKKQDKTMSDVICDILTCYFSEEGM